MNYLNKYNLSTLFFISSLLISCYDNIYQINAFGADVSSTKSVLETGLYEGEKYQYVISSYPVIDKAKKNNSNIQIVSNLKEEYNKKYHLNGFPQAGLFINTELENSNDKQEKIVDFLNIFDNRINLLINKDISNFNLMNSFSIDFSLQTNYFGFDVNDLNSSLIDNKLSFVNLNNNPSINELNRQKEILKFNLNDNNISKYYLKSSEKEISINNTLDLKIVCPLGAPACTLLDFVINNNKMNNNIEITTPLNVRSKFNTIDSDFIIFDSTIGINLASDRYKLVRMVTYGNLFLVSNGTDDNNKLDKSDKIFSYGENLIPGKVSKLIYEG